MADILSQLEIDKLLDVSMGDNAWPLFFYVKQPTYQIITVDKDFAKTVLKMDTDSEIYSEEIKLAIESKLDINVIKTMYSQKAVAIMLQQRKDKARELAKELNFIDTWLEQHPEYVV